tara:strand:- start:309 stop:644 length:336 start_codon:yes stop_codon:yes gene_type:complete
MEPDETSNGSENRQMAEGIYDMLMGDIEPDLLLANIPGLDEKHSGESEEEHKERMQRYKDAYKKFDEELAEFMGKVKKETRDNKRTALKEKESEDRKGDEQELHDIEAAFD